MANDVEKAVALAQPDKTARLRDTRARPEDLPLFDPTPDIKDFTDTAAILHNLDLLIAVDTALVHLAGALALPVWTLIDVHNDWRWMIDRDVAMVAMIGGR